MITNDDERINNVDINIFRTSSEGFVDEEIILRTIDNFDTIENLVVKQLDTELAENKLELNPYIEGADCYVTLNGEVKVNVKERTPVLRIYNKDGKSIYLQENGDFIPLSNKYSPRVMIASGYINEEIKDLNTNIYDSIYDGSHFRSVFYLYNLIAKNSFLNSQISQIYVNSKGEYDLVPVIGEHIIKMGNLENSTEKLQNLEAYYKKNLIRPDWDKYSIINLTYKDQIVCTKK
jgi:cell division protein FtsQ